MTPERDRAWATERDRAWATTKALNVQWHIPTEAVAATISALTEVEHLRPVVEMAKLIVDASSGEARAVALEATIEAVSKLRESGR